ncbi:MAG: M56 family metallopeptidase [Acidobacteriia bacterium]|nr:M56 family metallopeptidase [Terriglobia bacterium]
MTAALNLNAIAQISAERLVDCLVEGVIITACVGLLLRVIRRQNSGTRFAVWFSVLLAIPLLAVSGGIWASVAGIVPATAGAVRPAITVPASWALYLVGAWALLAGVGLVRVGAGLWHLYRLRKSCVAIEATSLDPVLQEMLRRFQAPRAVTICSSDRVQAPTALGFIKPAVVLPSGLMQELSTVELQSVLLHELAHLRRRDDWTNLVQKILKALLFFHPAVWWVEQRISLEREMACDDAVLAETADPRAYARCLVYLAEKSFVRRSLRLAQAAVGRLRHTSMRVAQILDGDRPRTTRVWKPAVSLVAVLSCASLIFLGRAPKLVGFRDDTTRVVAHAAAAAPVLPTAAKGSVPTGAQDAAPKPAVHKVSASRQALAAKLQAKPPVPQRNDSAIKAKLAPQENALAVVPAKSGDEGMTLPATILVFVESRSYGANGILEWQVAVWRVTVQQTDNPAAKGITRKSI